MTLSQLVLDQGENGIHTAVERLMSDILLPFAKTNFTMISPQKRRPLFQGLHGVSPSSRRVILSAEQFMEKAMEHPIINPFEQQLAGLLGGGRRVPSEYLQVLIGQVCEQTRQDFDGPRHSRIKRNFLRVNEYIFKCPLTGLTTDAGQNDSATAEPELQAGPEQTDIKSINTSGGSCRQPLPRIA
jgi:hypothetical protein